MKHGRKIVHILFTTLYIITFTSSIHAVLQTISTPGAYALKSSIQFTPSSANETIITINSSDVVLDLGGHTLSQTNNLAGCNGIVINSNLSNVIVKNGTIKNITGKGISVGSGCSQITLDSLTTLSCDLRGIECLGTPASKNDLFTLSHILIAYCCKEPTNGDYGLILQHATHPKLSDCRLYHQGSTLHATTGIYFHACDDMTCEQIIVDNTIGSTYAAGYAFSSLTNCSFLWCNNNDSTIYAANGIALGFDFKGSCTGCVLSECLSDDCTATISGGTAYGFRILVGNDDLIFSNCKTRKNAAHGACYGFYSECSVGTVYDHCFSQRNNSTNGNAVGFSFNQCVNNICQNSTSDRQVASTGIAIGIDCVNCAQSIFNNCSTTINKGSNDTNSYGLRQINGNANGFLKNIAFSNGALLTNQLYGLMTGQKVEGTSSTLNTLARASTNIGLT